jgi:CheY-like chemotaxis protein
MLCPQANRPCAKSKKVSHGFTRIQELPGEFDPSQSVQSVAALSHYYFSHFMASSPGATIQSAMALDSLLLSRDPQVIRVLRPTLEKLSIDVEVCRGARSGNEILTSEKFDAVIVDCDDLQGGLEVLSGLRKGTSNRNSVTFAILNGTTTTSQAFELGANFVLQKPISPLNASRCFGAALGFMERERRRYFRHPIEIPVTIGFGQGEEIKGKTSNISEGGMAVCFRGKLPQSKVSKITFTLPGTSTPMEPKAELAWADGAGRAGLRFLEVPQSSRDVFESWLSEQMRSLPNPAR